MTPPNHQPQSHVVCYSGGHSSALAAIEVARRFGTEHLVLLNHNITPVSEATDIKRFKREVATYLGVPITYANMDGWATKDQFDVVREAGAFKVGNGTALCTNRMKTAPFEEFLKECFPNGNCVVYYGFDASETRRIQRRLAHLSSLGYQSDYPLALWPQRTIQSTREVGIEPPNVYSRFKHANCVGCLKAGRQHWYVVFCTRPDVWAKAKFAEEDIGYTIIKGVSLTDLEPLFERMRCAGIEASEHTHAQTFWAKVRALGLSIDEPGDQRPCECVI